MQIVVVASDRGGTVIIWGAADIYSVIQHRTFYLHVVLTACIEMINR
jgi:hypothetical protein